MLIDYGRLLRKVKSSVGPRYSPKLHVELPISDLFDGICRSKKFYEDIRSIKGKLTKEIKSIAFESNNKIIENKFQILYDLYGYLITELDKIIEYDTKIYNWDFIQQECTEITKLLWELNSLLREEKEKVEGIKSESKSSGYGYTRSPAEIISSKINDLYKIIDLVRSIKDYARSNKAILSNGPYLYIKGEAGSGKTHLLCDLFDKRITGRECHDTIMVLGEFFNNKDDIYSQIFNQCDIQKNRYENTFDLIGCGRFLQKQRVLKYLNNQGKVNKNRSLIIIDALNENSSNAPDFWKKNIDCFVEELKKYPHIGLIVSVRVGFETQVFTKDQENIFLNVKHEGLKFKEREAVNKFFQEFDLPLPEVPLLMTEFQNPLFLILFCSAFGSKTIELKGKSRREKKQTPGFRGHSGSTHIFEKFIEFSSTRLCQEFSIHKGIASSPVSRIWNFLIKSVADNLITNTQETISEDDLKKIISTNFTDLNVSLFIKGLERNNLLVKVPIYSEEGEIQGYGYRFPFQKFSDFLLTRYIFKKYELFYKSANLSKDKDTLKQFFDIQQETGKFLTNSWNYGIIEALSIECPEQMKGIELFEVAPYLESKYGESLYGAFINSLVRRSPQSLNIDSETFSKVLDDHIFKDEYLAWDFMNAVITTGPIVEHPLNAYRLHDLLIKIPMSIRDSWWSSNFIRDNYGNGGAIDRILQWSQLGFNKTHICDESILLCSIVLSWFLTTSNRYVRDRATKGLVSLLKDRIHLLIPLLERFKDVDDVYILERLYCITYGSLLFQQKGINGDKLKDLGEYIYDNIFKDGNPPAHILLRDYANCSIQRIIDLGISFDFGKTTPPYSSDPITYPDESDLREKYYPYDKDEKDKKGIRDIWGSVMSGGDFERYIIGTNSHNFYRSGYTLDNKLENKQVIYDEFLDTLNQTQKDLRGKISIDFALHRVMQISNFSMDEIEENGMDEDIQVMDEDIQVKKIGLKYPDDKENDHNSGMNSKEKFKKSLSAKQLLIFESKIEPYLNDHGSFSDPYERFNLENAKNRIFNRVIELGYSPDLHGEYDDNLNRGHYSRDSHKSERIGKKYQWIAYHEFLARVSDYHKFNGGRWKNEGEFTYKGAWNPHVRDIDVSFLLQDDSHLKEILHLDKREQDNMLFDLSQSGTNIDWIKDYQTIPKIEPLIEITDDKQKQWLLLEGFYKREGEHLPEDNRYDVPKREVWYMMKSYLVKKDDSAKFKEWLNKQNFMGRWMPESHSFYEVFLGEYPNSEAFEDVRGDYNIDVDLNDRHRSDGSIDTKVIVTDDAYSLESGYDCSIEESVSMKLPSRRIIEGMELIHKDINGIFYNKNGEIVSFCNQIFNDMGRSGILIDKEKFIEFLEKKGYVIYWTMLGEKQMIGGSLSGSDYIGRLELSGNYYLGDSNQVEGSFRHKFTTR